MLTATLGGLIKDYRLKKRLSQLDVSYSIGWQDATMLSRIEQGRVGKPTRETIEKIMKALKLTPPEKGEFLYIGGYIPTDAEIEKTLIEIKPIVDNSPYPSFIKDFAWRILYTNDINLKFFNMDLKWKKIIEKNKPSGLALPFLSKKDMPVEIMKGEDKNNLKPFSYAQIAIFKAENYKFQNERWYQEAVANLMGNQEFRKVWAEVDAENYHKKLLDYEFKQITGIYGGKKRTFTFYMYITRLIDDPRFQIAQYHPADRGTEAMCATLRGKLPKLDTKINAQS